MVKELRDFAEWLDGEYFICNWGGDYGDEKYTDTRKTPEQLVIEYMISKEGK